VLSVYEVTTSTQTSKNVVLIMFEVLTTVTTQIIVVWHVKGAVSHASV